MASLAEILRRFRSHGVPGAAGIYGVPVNREAEFDAELEPVFAALEAEQRRADELVTRAAAEADERRTAGAQAASELVAEARAAAAAERAEAAASVLSQGDERRREILAGAAAEADRIDRVAAERIPAVAGEALRRLFEAGAGAV